MVVLPAACDGWLAVDQQLTKQCKMAKNWPYCGSSRSNSTRIGALEGPLRAPHIASIGRTRNWSSSSSLVHQHQPNVESTLERLISW